MQQLKWYVSVPPILHQETGYWVGIGIKISGLMGIFPRASHSTQPPRIIPSHFGVKTGTCSGSTPLRYNALILQPLHFNQQQVLFYGMVQVNQPAFYKKRMPLLLSIKSLERMTPSLTAF